MKPVCRSLYLNGAYVPADRELEDARSATYDVLRVVDGAPLFLEAHVERVNNALVRLGHAPRTDLAEILDGLIRANGDACRNANVKILAGGAYQLAAAFIESHYPDARQYREGVRLVSERSERIDPESKIWREDYKEAMKRRKRDSGAFEVLLVDQRGRITEGSQSNVFFVSGDTVMTPASGMLPGVTRRYVEQAIADAGIPLAKGDVPFASLERMDAAFLTGTSLHILPVRAVDETVFDAQNPVLRRAMAAFETLRRDDIRRYKEARG